MYISLQTQARKYSKNVFLNKKLKCSSHLKHGHQLLRYLILLWLLLSQYFGSTGSQYTTGENFVLCIFIRRKNGVKKKFLISNVKDKCTTRRKACGNHGYHEVFDEKVCVHVYEQVLHNSFLHGSWCTMVITPRPFLTKLK